MNRIFDYPPRTQSSWLGILEERLPPEFNSVLKQLRVNNLMNNVVYDIGANAGFFTKVVRRMFPDVRVIGFEAFDFHKPVHDFFCWETYFVGLSNCNGHKDFFMVPENDERNRIGGGNSYYKENIEHSKCDYSERVSIEVRRLDDLVREYHLPDPDLIKIDVQGAELDVIEGAKETFSRAKSIIIELQFVEYNLGAPDYQKVADSLKEIGFNRMHTICKGSFDGDFLFLKS